jgi:hypothetical protein
VQDPPPLAEFRQILPAQLGAQRMRAESLSLSYQRLYLATPAAKLNLSRNGRFDLKSLSVMEPEP